MRLRRWAGAAALLAAALAVAGCGGEKTGDVTGTVTVDGQPPPNGSSIRFAPTDGKSSGGGGQIESGKYSVSGVAVGPAKVTIIVPKFAAEKKALAGPGGEGDRVVGEVVVTDEGGSTDLTYEVKPGRNEKNWSLKSKGK
jgi:hypothetical protein